MAEITCLYAGIAEKQPSGLAWYEKNRADLFDIILWVMPCRNVHLSYNQFILSSAKNRAESDLKTLLLFKGLTANSKKKNAYTKQE